MKDTRYECFTGLAILSNENVPGTEKARKEKGRR